MAASNYYNRLVVKETPYKSSWMTDTNHLRSFLDEIEPEKVDSVVNNLFMQRQDRSTPLLSILETDPTTMTLDGASDSWSWDFDKPVVPAEVLEATEVGNSNVGINKQPFDIILDRDWFTYGDVISPDRFSGKFVRVMPDGITRHGSGWKYRVQLVTDDALAYFPSEYLVRGIQYEFIYSIYGEMNDQGTKPVHGGKIKLMNSLGGELRTDFSISDWADALTITVSSVAFDKKGNPIKVNDSKWFKREELAAWEKHRRQKENYLTFGQSGSNLASSSPYDVTSSMGLWQMAHLGNVQYYNHLSMRKLEESIGEMYYGRTAMDQRNVELYTGEAGFLLFSRAVELKLNGLGGLIPLDKFITGSGMNMKMGYQFKSYEMPNGGVITLKHLKTLDQATTKSERGKGKYSKLSACFFGLDMSNDNRQNIKIVKRKSRAEDYWGYVAGTCSPYGPNKGGLSSHKRGGYDVYIQSRIGLHIEDVTKMFMLKPTFEF